MIAAAATAITLNSGLQQVKKENEALNTRISGLQRAIRLEQLSQASQPAPADLEQQLATEKTSIENARARLPSTANIVSLIGDLARRAESNYLIAVPLSSQPPSGDLTKSTYYKASVSMQLTGSHTDVMVFLSGLERAGSGDYILEVATVSFSNPAGLESVPPLNETIVTAEITISAYYRPQATATAEARQ
jgi:Tfp pilus assembly protein PilO